MSVMKLTGLKPERAGDVVDRAVGGRQQRDEDARDHHPAQEVRQVDRRLDGFAQRPAAHLVEQQRDDDRHREDEDDLHAAR